MKALKLLSSFTLPQQTGTYQSWNFYWKTELLPTPPIATCGNRFTQLHAGVT